MTKTFYFIDDDEDIRILTKEMLECYDFNVETASSGNEAFEYLTSNNNIAKFDYIISDVRMPNGDGMQLLDKLNTEFQNRLPPFLFLTGFADFSLESIKEKGAIGYLNKPLDLYALEKLLGIKLE